MHNFPAAPALRFYRPNMFQPLTLHPRTCGLNVRLGADCRTAVRNESEFCNGYVFSSRPIGAGESWVVQIVQTEGVYVGGMGFGFTTCNPASLSPSDLPDDADLLIDRPEYWVISKDVARGPALGDELEFHLSHAGQVTMTRNRGPVTLLMHVDVSLPLWAVFDVYGSTRALRVLGTIAPPAPVVEQQQLAPPSMNSSSSSSRLTRPEIRQPIYQTLPCSAGVAQPPPPPIPAPILSSGTASYVETLNNFTLSADGSSVGGECTVCYERQVDCVLYSCGHMCLCFQCALELHRGSRSAGQGLCPICRAPIRDVIRAYRS